MKEAIERNFDLSVEKYVQYEQTAGVFQSLADKLVQEVSAASTSAPEIVIELGAGTGAGTNILLEQVGCPVAIDLSENMLQSNPSPIRIQGDFEQLPIANSSTDWTIYTASLFLAEHPDKAAAEACRVLRPSGVIGATAPVGWYRNDQPIFASLDVTSQSPSSAEEIHTTLKEYFDLRTGNFEITVSAESFRDFFSIPALAARLYPRLPPDERVNKANKVLADINGPVNQRWKWFVGRK
ncbi:class I SAM-dependent methyltransferase [Salinarchaeum sp. IM2453]|uniref:class I SAM-dependent methyltransferase n=1 Tax=Salinarchaeum sp. IM2453 TaxID=2862870 RepID=UPI001C83D485|nr:class I SAM-dependent methyltransferase [Salinarchaeum sp. IM2453]QZA88270.1 class I SAM-dependent methyltransferase [Salinarchaeum sp. IM2453]